jgi:hypothetical protein
VRGSGRSQKPSVRGRTLAAALFCCVVAAATLAGPARAGAIKAIWGPTQLAPGVNYCPSTVRQPCSAFHVYRQLGVDVYQYQVHWDQIAPTRPRNPRNPDDPAYRWGELDRIAAEARAWGIRLALLIQRAPSWANGGRPPIWAPRNPRLFADFLYAASRRLPSVRMWMIWGEPPRAENFRPMAEGSSAGPRLYARLLDAAYGALKSARRSNLVVGGMTLNGGTMKTPPFLRWMKLPNGRPPRMDLFGHNPFDGRFPRLADEPIGRFRGLNDIDTLHREVRAYYRRGHRKVPRLWLSEWTVISDRPSRIFANFYVSVRNQARWLRAAYAIVRRTPYVAGLGWFSLLDEPLAPGSANWGLLRADGTPKPAFNAYRRVP